MSLPESAHTSQPWRIHALAGDFTVEDVWALPTPGGPDDLPRLVALIASQDRGGEELPAAVRALFALRWRIGALFGWDGPDDDVGDRVVPFRDRLPADLLAGPRGPDLHAVPGRDEPEARAVFHSVYLTQNEWVAEYANRTVHSLMHIGWVPDGAGGHRGQMAVLVKPNGLLGKAYMAAIKPFRHALVYPALLRLIGRRWRAGTRSQGATAGTTRPAASST
jgi:hypothetical protein